MARSRGAILYCAQHGLAPVVIVDEVSVQQKAHSCMLFSEPDTELKIKTEMSTGTYHISVVGGRVTMSLLALLYACESLVGQYHGFL